MEKETLYLVWSNQYGCWRKNDSSVLTTKRKDAKMYTFDDAVAICKCGNADEENVPNEVMVPIEVCARCSGTGIAETGSFDDIREVPCPACRKEEHDGDGEDD